jgi:hypothetical protein
MAAIEADKELAAALLGDDTAKIQDTLKMLFEAQKREVRENPERKEKEELVS